MELISYNSLNPEKAEKLAQAMDEVLVDYQIYQQNIRKIQWDQRLRPYLDLSQKVNILYGVTEANTHNLARQILKLGHSPTTVSNGSTALMKSHMTQIQEVRNFDEAIYGIIHTSGQLLEAVQEVFYLAAEYEEKQSLAMMGQLAQQLNFTIWAFSSVRSATNN